MCTDSVMSPEIGSASSLWNACFSRAIDSVSPMNGMKAGKISTPSGSRPKFDRPPLDVVVVGPPTLGRRVDLEDRLGPARSEVLAGGRRAGLDQHRPALRRVGHVQRAAGAEVLRRRGRRGGPAIGVGEHARLPCRAPAHRGPSSTTTRASSGRTRRPARSGTRGPRCSSWPKFCASLWVSEVTMFHATRPLVMWSRLAKMRASSYG